MLLTGVANAEEASSGNAAAQALFEQARQLMKQGKPEQACPKFAESQRLDPGVGTQFNLADCYERTGRLATAQALFLEVAHATRLATQNQRAALAEERAAAIAPRLSRLIISVDRGNQDVAVRVTRNGDLVGGPQFGVAIPVDLGVHQIHAEAPGKTAFHQTLRIEREGVTETLAIPRLVDAPSLPSKPSDRKVEEEVGFFDQSKNWVGVALVGAGALGLGVGTGYGLRASHKKKQSNPYCDADGCIEPGLTARESAYTAGNVSTVALAGGAALVVAGGVLMLIPGTPSDQKTANRSLRVGLAPLSGGAFFSLTGAL